MTLQEIAEEIGQVAVADVAELADLIFDEIEAAHSVAEVQEINAKLLEAGVDCAGICKRKHPPAP